ncbi:MAG TPA: RHS repeat-associated core domain-containing protein [Candidatus Dormibacteraeota bacterium]|nr:RHS repeat-associated core domain-containing protein [Candidatus Dormibacteraeota bacterium]
MGSTQQVFNVADQICWTAAISGSCASPPTGSTSYIYDTRGNRTRVTPPTGGATNLSYDQANRLTAYGQTATYAYNGDGLRMSKTVSGTTSQFLWNMVGSLPLLIKDGSIAYLYGPGGLPLEQINASIAVWLHHDQLGSTRLVTDAIGANQATYTFDAYGKLKSSSGTILNPFDFAGQYLDAESNSYYLRARYYDPSTGQFLSRDRAIRTREPYGYAYDSPTNNVDPAGLSGFSCLCQLNERITRNENALPYPGEQDLVDRRYALNQSIWGISDEPAAGTIYWNVQTQTTLEITAYLALRLNVSASDAVNILKTKDSNYQDKIGPAKLKSWLEQASAALPGGDSAAAAGGQPPGCK